MVELTAGEYGAATRDRWSAPARAESVGQLRRAVAEFAINAGVGGGVVVDLRSCVSEAVTNAVVHAFRNGLEPGTVVVSAELEFDALVVVVSDDGVGFLPRNDSPGAGLGIPTIAALASEMSLTTPAGGGTEVRMVFVVDPLG